MGKETTGNTVNCMGCGWVGKKEDVDYIVITFIGNPGTLLESQCPKCGSYEVEGD